MSCCLTYTSRKLRRGKGRNWISPLSPNTPLRSVPSPHLPQAACGPCKDRERENLSLSFSSNLEMIIEISRKDDH